MASGATAPTRKPHMKEITARALPTCEPEIAVKEYFLSKFEERLAKRKPEWDAPRMTPATELVAARRELFTADKQLAEKRRFQETKRKEMDAQWDDLRGKETLLRQSFLRFSKFVKENQEKRERAERKVREEIALQERRDEEIRDLEEKVVRLTAVKENLESHVNEYKIYEAFLERVVRETKEFQDIHDILSRYETLSAARAELAARQEKDIEALEATRTEMIKLTEEKCNVIMGLNNKMAELQLRYDRAKIQATRWEAAVSHIKATAAQKTSELGQAKTSCWNIYQQICKRKNVPPSLDMNDIENQLRYIKRTILELKKVVRIAKKRAAKETMSGIGEQSQASTGLPFKPVQSQSKTDTKNKKVSMTHNEK